MDHYAISRRLTLNYRFAFQGEPLRRVLLRCALPKNIPFQQDVLGIKCSTAPELIFMDNGNRFAQFDIREIPSKMTLDVAIDMIIHKNDLSQRDFIQRISLEQSQEEMNRYLVHENYIESFKQAIVKKAATLKADNKYQTLRNIYDFVNEHMTFTDQTKTQGALYAMSKGTGDCSEYSALFIALCRINKIPAKWVVGHTTKGKDNVATHAWTEVWFDEHGWIRIDPTRRDFENPKNYYIKLIDTDYKARAINGSTTYQWKYWGKACKVELFKSVDFEDEIA